MVRIVSDTSTMYSTLQAKEAGFDVSPLAVTIAGETQRELDEMTAERFVSLIRQGNMPKSSQPSLGDVVDLYSRYQGDEILNIAMADGLSGTYSSAVAAANMCEGEADVVVINSETLCGPHRCMVETAVRLAKEGMTRAQIVEKMEEMKKQMKSFLMPADFDYLRRGGRLSPLVSFVGKTIKLAPVLTQSPDGRQLVMSAIKRSFKQAVAHVAQQLEAIGVGEGWRVYVTHADAPEMAKAAEAFMAERFPLARIEVYLLTPAFITQGGPECVAIQAIREL